VFDSDLILNIGVCIKQEKSIKKEIFLYEYNGNQD
jgi:hypothetical protein